jgi:2-oxo-3-hexenedioate decarboxylase
MTPEQLLAHYDQGRLWPAAPSQVRGFDVAAAYQAQLAVRRLRISRGEQPRGFKIGFTNRGIWARYGVDAPVWGTVWNTTLTECGEQGTVALGASCQPRIEPEAVFGIARTPPQGATLDQLFECLDWVGPGFEIVQSHSPGWKFQAADTVADGGLHAHLLVGRKTPVRGIATTAAALDRALVACEVRLLEGAEERERGTGASVLDGPLHALHHFLTELRSRPGAPDLRPGDVVTTGTWTDAYPVSAGQVWVGLFGPPLQPLEVRFA